MSDLHRYTTFKVSKQLGEMLDQWILKHEDYLRLIKAVNRSAAVEYILVRVFEAEGMVSQPNLGAALLISELRDPNDPTRSRKPR